MTSSRPDNWIASLVTDGRATAQEVIRNVALRRELAEAELQYDLQLTKRFGMIGGLGLTMLLVALPLAVTAAALALDNTFSLSSTVWLLLFSIPLGLIGFFIAYTSWQSYQQKVRCFQESLAQLQEDIEAIHELFQQ